ncbi:MAG: amidophosphoribosyltransferase, partial [Saccharofermentanales bacterium]
LLFNFKAKEVHIRPACPPLVFGCKYLNFSRSKSEMDLITRRVIKDLEGSDSAKLDEYSDPRTDKYDCMVDCIKKRLNFTSLKYQNLYDMLDAIGIEHDKVCTYCWTGKE